MVTKDLNIQIKSPLLRGFSLNWANFMGEKEKKKEIWVKSVASKVIVPSKELHVRSGYKSEGLFIPE